MDMFSVCFPVILIFFIAFTIIFLIISKKHFLASFPNKEKGKFREQIIETLRLNGYKVKEKGKWLLIEKDVFTVTSIYLEQNGSKVDIYRKNSYSAISWVLIIIGALFFLIGAIIVGYISDKKSKEFSEIDLLSLLQNIDVIEKKIFFSR